MNWPDTIQAVLSSLTAASILGGAGLLVRVAIKVASIETALKDHITREGELTERVQAIEEKMPDGEIQETFRMVKEMYDRLSVG